MAVVDDFTALLSGYNWYFGAPAGRALVLTYSFSTAPEHALAGGPDVASLGFQTLDEAARTLARQALAQWSAASGVSFLEVTQHEGDLTFGQYDLAALGMAGAAGTGSYPSVVATLDGSGHIRLYPSPLHDGGDVHIDAAYRATATDADLLHVLLQQIGHTLGLKPPHVGSTTLQEDSGDRTVMSYAGPRNPFLGQLDIAAIQALYGSPTGALRPETWSWNAATETYTASIPGDGQYLRGTEAQDVLTALGNDVVVLTMGGDDVANIGSGAAEVNLGPGQDTVNVAMAFRPDQGMAIGFGGGGAFNLRIDEGAVQHWYYGVEELNFTNGSYDFANSRFVFTLPPPEAPAFRHWWTDAAGTLTIAGTGSPGSEVRFVGLSGSAPVAADGIWTIALPPEGAGTIRDLTAVASRQGQVSAQADLGALVQGSTGNDSLAAFPTVRAFIAGSDGDDSLAGTGGDDLFAGGAGVDTLELPGSLAAETRIGIEGDTVVLRGTWGMDTLLGVEQVDFGPDGIRSLASLSPQAEPMMTRLVAGQTRHLLADLHAGPRPGLRYHLTGDATAETVGGSSDNDLIEGAGGNDTISGLAGDDVLGGGAGDDTIDGGEGTDTAVFAGTRGQYRIGIAGDEIRVRGPDGSDALRGIERLEFGDGAVITAATLAGLADTEELMSLLVGGTLHLLLPDAYAGPLALRYVFTGTDGSDVAAGTARNDFLTLGAGDDAASAGAGDDIVDGGGGNNFLTGGAGRDTFFVDGRFLLPVWSCVTDWEAGEQLAIWGWQPGVSRYGWAESGGLPGYLGATFYGDLDGNGLVDTAVTVAGRSVAEMPGAMAQTAGGIGVLTFG